MDGAPAERTGIRRTILIAAVIAFLLDAALSPWNAPQLIGRLVVYPLVVAFLWALGWWLGTRTWPKRGRKLARDRLVAAIKHRREVLFISERPDREPSTWRRVWEAVGFAAGASVFVAAILTIVGFRTQGLAALASTFTIFAAWAGFLLVPYWLFARMGLRSIDAVRWTIAPVSRRYAGRLRLSNGALMLLGIGATANAAIRTDPNITQEGAIVSAVVVMVRIVTSVLVIVASAVAYYNRAEHALVRSFESEAMELGVRDGRGMTDGDFLPRLPPPKQPPPTPEPLMKLHLKRGDDE